MVHPLTEDLDHILTHTRELWDELRGSRIFITGGTGFFGCWLLESLAWANDRLGLDTAALVLTRDPEAMWKKAPHLATHPAIQLYRGDVRSFVFPQGRFSHIIHAASESGSNLNDEDPILMFDVVVQGTRRVLDFARQCGAGKILLTSTGAVYGTQPPAIRHINEEYRGAPDLLHPRSAEYEGKRAAELLCALYTRKYGIETKVARCFSFVGPYMPLDAHFAIGNFILNGLQGGPIVVTGDGTPYRSYLYAADLAIWLWTILFKGRSLHPYNVGSESEITIHRLAQTVAAVFGEGIEVQIMQEPVPSMPLSRYVPSTQRAQTEINLSCKIDLIESIKRTAAWYSCTLSDNHLRGGLPG